MWRTETDTEMPVDPVAAVDDAIAETVDMVITVKEKQSKRIRSLLSKHRHRCLRPDRRADSLLLPSTHLISTVSLIDAARTKGDPCKPLLDYIKVELKKPLGAQFAVKSLCTT